ncbi:MAG: Uma2 family endonuclease, partial [Blastocatellia bacterium]
MHTDSHWTTADLTDFPDNGFRYEIIGGELFVSKQPHFHHQYTCGQTFNSLQNWSMESKLGQTIFAPGVIFAEDDNVAPDVVWISFERRATALHQDGKFH